MKSTTDDAVVPLRRFQTSFIETSTGHQERKRSGYGYLYIKTARRLNQITRSLCPSQFFIAPPNCPTQSTKKMSSRNVLLWLFTCLGHLSWVDGFDGEGWEVAFWSGARCTSENTGVFKIGNFQKGSKYCHTIPDIGVTKAMDLYAADPSYKFGLHRNSDCTDDPSQFIGKLGLPICPELGLQLILGSKLGCAIMH